MVSLGTFSGLNGDESLSEAGLEVGDAPSVVIPPDDEAVVRRVKALATTRPLHDLDRSKLMWDSDIDWSRYDLLSLALTTIDVVALTQSLASGMARSEVVSYCAAQAARQNPAGSADELERIASRVVNALVSDQSLHVAYTDHSRASGDGPVQADWQFRLLSEQWRADGETIDVRATPAAINVLLDGLDLDIESAQVAAEAQMENLIKRGALQSAVAVAQRSRLLTASYIERVGAITRDTLIDARAHDWDGTVPQLLEDALAHVVGRVGAESALLDALEDSRAEARDPAMRRQANRLIELLAACRLRHTDLQRHLLGVRSALRSAHEERYRNPGQLVRRLDLESDLLVGLLEAPVGAVGDWCALLLSRTAGVAGRWWISGGELLDRLLTSPKAPDLGEEIEEPVFAEDRFGHWWEPYWDLAGEVLDGIGSHERLSDLAAALRDRLAGQADSGDPDGEALDEGLAVAALLHLAYEQMAVSLTTDDGDREVLVAVSTGERVDDGSVDGVDLLFVCARVDTSPETILPFPSAKDRP